MRKLGYITSKQPTDTSENQKELLKEAGCFMIYKDTKIGEKIYRNGLLTCLQNLNEDDILVVYSLDCLAKSITELLKILEKLQTNGCHLQTLLENIDTTNTPSFFHHTAILQETIKRMNITKTSKGRIGARARGRLGGRPKKASQKVIQNIQTQYRKKQFSINQLCKKYDISKPTLYKYLNS